MTRYRLTHGTLAVLAFFLAACSDSPSRPATAPQASITGAEAVAPPVRFSELHYDNAGTDSGEAIEISGPAGTDLTGWQIVLYNGSGGAPYDTKTLSGTIPATCGARGTVVQTYPANGIQNGSPDAMALVSPNGVVEFLSYEGTFTAVGGPADGLASVDIGVSETGADPDGTSLQRDANGVWASPAPSTFNVCNDNGPVTPPGSVATVAIMPHAATIAPGAKQSFTATAQDSAGTTVPGLTMTWSSTATAVATVTDAGVATGVAIGQTKIIAAAPNGVADTVELTVATAGTLPATRFSEIHYDNVGTDAGEAIEVEGPAGTSLAGWSVVLYNGNGGVVYNTQTLSGTIPAMCDGRGVVVVRYPQDGIQNGSPDGFALVDSAGTVVELLSYEGPMSATNGPAAGLAATDIRVSENSAPVGQSLQRTPSGSWVGPIASTLGACNGDISPPPVSNITISGRTPNDPALPVGFQDQIFATVHDATGATVATPVIWSSETPTIATIDSNGVMTALAAGTATFRATTADGADSTTYTLPMRVAVASTTAQYAGNAEFGEPTDADPSDDFIVHRPEYTLSYNRTRGTPNWVSYDLDATDFGSEDRCDCFTFDPLLPSSFPHFTTADYTGAGAAAGFGIDRGHLTRSFDRTSASLDNATTFYLSNVVPQTADLNEGPWAVFEDTLGDLARLQNKEVYIIAGVAGNRGTLKNEGKITIPAFTWKVAVILPRDQGLSSIHTAADLQVVAVVMPNVPDIRNVNWNTYTTTVDSVEALSGYDLLAKLPDDIEAQVESGSRPPVAAAGGPYAGAEGTPLELSAAASADPDGDALTFAWLFGDGTSGTGAAVQHNYAQDGAYNVQLIATDIHGLADTAVATATIANVAPIVSPFATATLLPGETYAATGTFADPGADVWSGSVDFGDATGAQSLALDAHSFTLSHVYRNAGSFTVAVQVSDGQATGAGTERITVLTAVDGVAQAEGLVRQLIQAGKLGQAASVTLLAKLEVAKLALERGHGRADEALFVSVRNEIDLLVRLGKTTATDVAPLRALVARLIQVASA